MRRRKSVKKPRRRLGDKAPKRKRLRQLLPDRAPPTKMIVGPKAAFTEQQIAGLEDRLDRAYDNFWIMIYSGPGYKDIELPVMKDLAQRAVKTFLNSYPDMEVTWIDANWKTKPIKIKAGKKFDKKKWLKKFKDRRACAMIT